jgi:hypothetical protein
MFEDQQITALKTKPNRRAKFLVSISVPVHCLVVILISVFLFALTPKVAADTSTPEDRAALFEYLLEKTMARESFSHVKNQNLSLDVKKEMLRYRDELVAADTDEKLYYALVKISNARKDRHLKVSLVKGGLTLPETTGVDLHNYPVAGAKIPHASVRFAVDYGTPRKYFIFVSDYSKDIADFVGKNIPEIGDKLLAINRQPISDYRRAIEPYHRYSTIEGFWWKFAAWIPQKSYQFPPSFYRERVTYLLERKTGEKYSITLPYLLPEKIVWEGFGGRRFPGFALDFSTETYDLYRRGDGKKVILLVWHGFRSNLVADIDRLMDYAVEHKLLDHDIILDGTRSRGGSKGAYAVRRLSPKPFKTTFGNLKLSDVTQAFIERKRQQFNQRRILDSGVSETIDDGTWLMDWLENDVTLGLKAGQSYSNNVPFKLAHLPKYSDGIIKPAKVHFRGSLICLFSPYGGSHLDQFASIVVDNSLGHTMGMSTGGYSNTWEWEEILSFPISKKPIVLFMWSIGHTIRPNGEVLEGNPAKLDEHIPLTRDNFLSYYPMLITRAMEHLGLE